MAKEVWYGSKSVRELNQDEMDDLKCAMFDTLTPDGITNEELFEVADGINFVYEDLHSDID